MLICGSVFVSCTTDVEPEPGKTITITFDLNYPDAPDIRPLVIDRLSAAGDFWPADPRRLGYAFGGWFSGAAQFTAQTVIGGDVTVTAAWTEAVSGLEDQPPAGELAALFAALPASLSNSWKIYGHKNPIATQTFSADPDVLVFEDRLYLYASNDTLEFTLNNAPSYQYGIQGVHILSTGDLANWTDHGAVNIVGTPNTDPLVPESEWAPPLMSVSGVDRSWAPTAAWKMIDGRPQFFMYWGNGGNGIGVISANSPVGPWRAPLDKLLIDRNTVNCDTVANLFDPGVLVDDDGQGYLFFGGGGELKDNTEMARRVRLGADMISLAGYPQTWYVPYLFEANNIKKIKGGYYFSYSTHGSTGGNRFGLTNYQIAVMKSTTNLMGTGFGDPMGVLSSPSGQLASTDTNNHQAPFEFKGGTYIAYHTQKAAEAMGIGQFIASRGGSSNNRLRSAFIDPMPINPDGVIPPVTMTRTGVEQVGHLNPFIMNEAETIGVQGGIYNRPLSGASNGMVVTSIDTGDWIVVYGVDFGSAGANSFMAHVRMPERPGFKGGIELRLDPQAAGAVGANANLTPANTTRITGGEIIGRMRLQAKTGEEGKFNTATINLDKTVTGVHDLVFVFYSDDGVRPEVISWPDSRHKNAFEFDSWQFFR
jgi:arabinoxylan arabinofuranohydrolase